ncbi:MAG: efflux RND transporter periplasmic adaptor subunit [Pseudomonadota bacterium]
MAKRIFLVILGLLLVVGTIGGIKALQIKRMIAHGKQFVPPPVTVTTATVGRFSWESRLSSVGSLTAVQGITVTAELTGKVVRIGFESGAPVKAGDLLVQQDTTSEAAQLRAAEASAALARSNFERIRELLPEKVATPADFDKAQAQFKEALAQVDGIKAVIDKKSIRAPFAGRLGIRMVNLGQILNDGNPIVSLQMLDPIFVNFSLPQQYLGQVLPGMTVRLSTDALPGRDLSGTITAINPEIDPATRNGRLQATLANPDERLHPGMFVTVNVVLPQSEAVLAIPATAVLYAPYSDSVFVVDEKQVESGALPGKVLRQQIVRTGEKRGDFVAVLSGLKENETVVSTGVFKLRNGQAVVVDNQLSPEFSLTPTPKDN